MNNFGVCDAYISFRRSRNTLIIHHSFFIFRYVKNYLFFTYFAGGIPH